MIRFSVFTVAALVFYLLSISLGAHFMTDYYKSGIAVIAGNSVTKTPMPCLDIIVVIMNIVLALRLYLHAWIMDESLDYRRAISSASRFKKSGEWLLRLLWVAGISWLPSAYKELPLKIGSFSFHIHHFLLYPCQKTPGF